jgi:uncharacterized membrane protein YqgA involved in biofilm formation
MFATIVDALAIVVGSLVGILLKKGLSTKYEEKVYIACGMTSLIIGIQMALKTSHILILAISLIVGGALGTWLDIEGAVLRLGELLKRRFAAKEEGSNFAYGFLDASVLFCSGAMAILGAFKAGTEGDYSLLYTKSVLDAFISIVFASAMGIGVLFSAFAVLLYQGALTLLSVWVKPYVSEVMLSELTGFGGALIVMIGLGLLNIKKCKTGDFLPGLLVLVALVLLVPVLPFL